MVNHLLLARLYSSADRRRRRGGGDADMHGRAVHHCRATSRFSRLKFIYSEQVTKFCEISTVDLSYVVPVKSAVLWSSQNI
jgi:hypothetical protein